MPSGDHALDQVGEFACTGVAQLTWLCGGQAWPLQGEADIPVAELWRTLPTPACGIHARHLDVRHGLVRPSRHGHTTPARSPRPTRFAVKEAGTAGFAVKRLDWMTKDTDHQTLMSDDTTVLSH